MLGEIARGAARLIERRKQLTKTQQDGYSRTMICQKNLTQVNLPGLEVEQNHQQNPPPQNATESLEGGQRRIPLTRGLVAIVDAEDYDRIIKFRWHINSARGEVYATRWFPRNGGKQKICRMHRIIIGAKQGECVDHINHNTLDNRKCNLRICSQGDNVLNARRKRNGYSTLKGAHLEKLTGKWTSSIRFRNKQIYLGIFKSELEAHNAYCIASAKYHGEFGCTESMLIK